MGAARGIAGSREPEVEGVFLCLHPEEADWFVRLNNTGGPVDVWAVDGVDPGQLRVAPEGHSYFPGTIEAHRVHLAEEGSATDQTSGAPARHRRRNHR